MEFNFVTENWLSRTAGAAGSPTADPELPGDQLLQPGPVAAGAGGVQAALPQYPNRRHEPGAGVGQGALCQLYRHLLPTFPRLVPSLDGVINISSFLK